MVRAAEDGRTPISRAAEAEARQRFQHGNHLFDRRAYEAALDEFRSAYELWKNPKITLNIATTLRALGRTTEALQAYREYVRDGQLSPERQAEVNEICSELSASLATVRLHVNPGVKEIWLDGEVLDGTGPGLIYIEPGDHIVSSDGASGEDTLEFEIGAGEERELAIGAKPPASDLELPHLSQAVKPSDSVDSPALRSPLSLLARADIDGRGRGLVGVAGLGYGLGSHVQVAGGGLFGRTVGVWLGLELLPGEGALQPTFGLSAPVFFDGGARAGLSGQAGVRWAIGADRFFLRCGAAVVHFPSVPDGYATTVFVPSLGSELRI